MPPYNGLDGPRHSPNLRDRLWLPALFFPQINWASPKQVLNKQIYIFPVTLESDDEGWRAFSPSLEAMGASTRGETQEEALKNVREVLAVMLEGFLEEGQDMAAQGIVATEGAVITITR